MVLRRSAPPFSMATVRRAEFIFREIYDIDGFIFNNPDYIVYSFELTARLMRVNGLVLSIRSSAQAELESLQVQPRLGTLDSIRDCLEDCHGLTQSTYSDESVIIYDDQDTDGCQICVGQLERLLRRIDRTPSWTAFAPAVELMNSLGETNCDVSAQLLRRVGVLLTWAPHLEISNDIWSEFSEIY